MLDFIFAVLGLFVLVCILLVSVGTVDALRQYRQMTGKRYPWSKE